MITNHIELKENFLKNIVNEHDKDLIFRDTKQSGLGLKVTPKGIKTFFVEGWVNGRSRRKKIGRSPEVSIEQARKDAKGFMGDFSRGIDKVADTKAKKNAEITLEQLFNDYLSDRKKLKEGTIKDYKRILNEGLKDWHDKQISSITKQEVSERHKKLSKNSEARADNTMRVLRALFNYAMEEYEIKPGQPLIIQNPALILTSKKTWNNVNRKNTYIKDDQLSAWFDSVLNLQSLKNSFINEVVSDYFLFLIFSGFRETEGKQLEWKNIDFKKKTFRATDTKNGTDQLLPMSDYLESIFKRRFKKKDGSSYVFPNKDGEPLKDMRAWYRHVSKESGVDFTLHDLRRTFATVAESLDISHYAIKRLVNHRADKSDVTEGYIQIGAERLRKPMQQITDHMLLFSETIH
jgi:integrase